MVSRVGTLNPNWKGGIRIHPRGYRMVQSRDHPRADRYGYVFEHIIVMDKHLGRFVTKDEDVHHINGDKLDNRIENLELLIHGEHSVLSNGIDMSARHCVDCDSNETYNRNWHNAGKSEFRCHNCYMIMYTYAVKSS